MSLSRKTRRFRLLIGVIGLCLLLTLLVSGAILAARVDRSAQVCLAVRNSTSQPILVDTASGAYFTRPISAVEQRRESQRGAVSRDGRYIAYLAPSDADQHIFRLARNESQSAGPGACADLDHCAYAASEKLPAETLVERSASGDLAIGWISWAPQNARAIMIGVQSNGDLTLIALSPDGKTAQMRAAKAFGSGTAFSLDFLRAGWSPDRRYFHFAVASRARLVNWFFWSPEDDFFRQYRLPRLGLRDFEGGGWAPGGKHYAFTATENLGGTVLYIIDPTQSTPQNIPIPESPQRKLNWSPDGHYLALRYFEAPHWRMDIIGVDGQRARDIGGVFPSDEPQSRSGEPQITWTQDGKALMLLSEYAPGKYRLVRYLMDSTRYETILPIAANPIWPWPQGYIVALAPLDGTYALYRISPDGRTTQELTRGITRILAWVKLDTPETLAYVAERGGKISIEMVDVWAGVVHRLADDLITVSGMRFERVDSGSSEFVFVLAWDGLDDNSHGLDAYGLDGKRRYRFRSDNPATEYTVAPDRRSAVAVNAGTSALAAELVMNDDALPASDLPWSAYDQVRDIRWSPDSTRFAAILQHASDPRVLQIHGVDGKVSQSMMVDARQIEAWTDCTMETWSKLILGD